MLAVQKYLFQAAQERGSHAAALVALTADLGISARVYEEQDVVLLDYDQIESPKTHPVVIECRSLILRLSTFEVLSRKMDRFFNYGEAPDTLVGFDFGRAVALEKADGSLMGVWYDPAVRRWNVSTRGMAYAEGLHTFGLGTVVERTFEQHAVEAFGLASMDELNEKFNQLLVPTDEWLPTFVFEFISPENRVVTKYDQAQMVLITVSTPDSEWSPGTVDIWAAMMQEAGLNVRRPRRFGATSLDGLVEQANQLTGLEEGFVVHDAVAGKRIKIKSQTYLAAHKLRGNGTPTRKSLLSVILDGEIDELLAVFPEFVELAEPLREEVRETMAEMEGVWVEFRSIESQKDFALAVKDFRFSGFLFTARAKKQDPVHVFNTSTLTQKLRLFGV